MADATDFKIAAGALNRAVSGIGRMGVDVEPIRVLVSAAKLMQGSIVTYTAIRAAADRMTRVNEARFVAALIKYGPFAGAFAVSAIAAGVAAEILIDRALRDVDG